MTGGEPEEVRPSVLSQKLFGDKNFLQLSKHSGDTDIQDGSNIQKYNV